MNRNDFEIKWSGVHVHEGRTYERVVRCLLMILLVSTTTARSGSPQRGWDARAARDELRPEFSFEESGGQNQNGSLVLETSHKLASMAIGRGPSALKADDGIVSTHKARDRRRSAPAVCARTDFMALCAWPGGAVRRSGRSHYASGEAPISEPEYPHDGEPNGEGWVMLEEIYHAPSAGRIAIVELHLRWWAECPSRVERSGTCTE